MESREELRNVYDDERRARAYAELAFPGTYSLAFRDLPALFARQVTGLRALDFGCGTGRSTRFLRDLGFQAIGVDVSAPMLERARHLDPGGDYRQVPPDGPRTLPAGSFDLILSAFTFDNLGAPDRKRSALDTAPAAALRTRALDQRGLLFRDLRERMVLVQHAGLSRESRGAER